MLTITDIPSTDDVTRDVIPGSIRMHHSNIHCSLPGSLRIHHALVGACAVKKKLPHYKGPYSDP